MLPPIPAARTIANAARGEKRLFSGMIQAIFTSAGTSVEGCRVRQDLECTRQGLRHFENSLS